MHGVPALQTFPQLPQLFGSLWTEMQPDRQHASLPVHAGPPAHPRQTLATQVSPGLHAFPQKPQFCGSLVVSEQPVPQH
jgi:hypothetical protein